MITLEVTSPEKVVFREPVEYVSVPSTEGMYGLLPGHAPMVAALRAGVVQYRQGGKRRSLAIAGGFMEATPEKVTILADEAELPHEIDVAKTRQELEAARRVIEAGEDTEAVARAKKALERATFRLRVAGEE